MIEERDYLIHPHFIMLYLLLGGISALFIGFSLAYLYSRVQGNLDPIELPSLFYINTLILLSASFCLIRAKQFYLTDQTEKYKRILIVALVISIVFLASQIFAWLQLYQMNISLTHSNLASYLYVISGIHFAHVLAGIPFLGYFIFKAYKKMREPVSVLIYFSDPAKKRQLDILTQYWHFIDGLWIYLVIFFLANYLI